MQDSKTILTIRPRKGGKTGVIEPARPVREILPLSNADRLANYEKQNAGRQLTGPQMRRLARHDIKCACDDDLGRHAMSPPWQQRFSRMRPVRQHFRPTIDNQHLPTGRTGMARFGPTAGIEALNQLLFGSRKSEKGMDLGSNAAASQRGRMMARTAHGRRRYRRQNRG